MKVRKCQASPWLDTLMVKSGWKDWRKVVVARPDHRG